MLIRDASHRPLLLLALAVFLGAYLSFQIQPLIAQWMLPKLGGSAAVWSASMLFFQVGLLWGYAYSFALTRYLSVNQQVLTHCALLVFSCLFLPWGLPTEPPVPQGVTPTITVLVSLGGVVGVPYVSVTATAPLLQALGYSFSATKSPYRLYVVSNLGSLLGLLAYPFVVGPSLDLQQQFLVWSVLFLAFAGIFLALGKYAKEKAMLSTAPAVESVSSAAEQGEKTMLSYFYWAGLSAAGSCFCWQRRIFLAKMLLLRRLFGCFPSVFICSHSLSRLITCVGIREGFGFL